MVKLKYKSLLNYNFTQAIRKLCNTQLEAKTAYWVNRIAKKLESEQKLLATKYGLQLDAWKAEWAEKLEDGSFKPNLDDPSGRGFIVPNEKQEAFLKVQDEWMQQEVELDGVEPINFEQLKNIKFSAAELEILDGVYVVTAA